MQEIVLTLGVPLTRYDGTEMGTAMIVVLQDTNTDVVADKRSVYVFTTTGAVEKWLASSGNGKVSYESLLFVRQEVEAYGKLKDTSLTKSVRFNGDAAMYFGSFVIFYAEHIAGYDTKTGMPWGMHPGGDTTVH